MSFPGFIILFYFVAPRFMRYFWQTLHHAMSRRIETVLVDLSGTLHIEDSAIPGALEALTR